MKIFFDKFKTTGINYVNSIYLKEKIVTKNFFNPTPNGLFCEKIFGPIKTGECLCKRNRKKQKIIRTKSKLLFCSICNIQITKSIARRYRMGYCDLAKNNKFKFKIKTN